ncbi:hypothetical protein [Parvicella tangerina]|uniref:Cytochrome c domain-containing protein n=1 Tax=Parvicella tangerina TaxID=2829795 RepID=A0A916JIG4_9FLAO|nr:hypothetical protein [Parvicella tangerina]CAG5076266.1 hypothetical protein CRYO30217_00020 [Parvicella tangerina]
MKKLLILPLILLLISSCAKDTTPAPEVIEPDVCDSIPKSFATDVQPIFNDNCVVCHNSSNNQANGQSWETHAEIAANIDAILTAINHEAGKTPMPYQLPKLSDSLIQVIECWASDGAPNN